MQQRAFMASQSTTQVPRWAFAATASSRLFAEASVKNGGRRSAVGTSCSAFNSVRRDGMNGHPGRLSYVEDGYVVRSQALGSLEKLASGAAIRPARATAYARSRSIERQAGGRRPDPAAYVEAPAVLRRDRRARARAAELARPSPRVEAFIDFAMVDAQVPPRSSRRHGRSSARAVRRAATKSAWAPPVLAVFQPLMVNGWPQRSASAARRRQVALARCRTWAAPPACRLAATAAEAEQVGMVKGRDRP